MYRPGIGNGSLGSSSLGSSLGSASPCSSVGSSPSPGPGTRSGHGALALFSFPLPSRQAKVAYKEQQHAIRRALDKAPGMDHGTALATLEKGVLFPVVHVCDSGALFQRYMDSGRMLKEDSLGPDYVLYQGCYQEVRCIAPEGTEVAAPPFDQLDGPRDYLLLGFKSVEESFSQVLEETWKDWTGARHIYLFLPDMLGLERISLYRRVEPDHMQLFRYLVLARLGPSPSDETATRAQEVLLDYAQRLRVHRITAYLSVYRSFPRTEHSKCSS